VAEWHSGVLDGKIGYSVWSPRDPHLLVDHASPHVRIDTEVQQLNLQPQADRMHHSTLSLHATSTGWSSDYKQRTE